MNKLFTQLLEARGINQAFLDPKYENLTDPNQLAGMPEAVARIEKAINNHEKILIYGDYDVDGVTASTLIEEALVLAGVQPGDIEIMLPDRFVDGYGMSPRLIQNAIAHHIGLVITVDCGSRNHAIVEELNHNHIDTIITDHHECEATNPDAVAMLNPHRQDAPTEVLQNLAGVGVAFKLAQALAKQNLIKNSQEKWLLDLVLIGTICDHMELTGENRILCHYGAIVLEKTRHKGLQQLMINAGVKHITSEAIGFQIGPRLNAAGRLETATISLNLLRSHKSTESAALAGQLEQLNKKRRTEQQSAVKEITQRYAKTSTKANVEPSTPQNPHQIVASPPQDPVIIESGRWHEGIIGIVAGRLTEKYHKPAFVLTETEAKTPEGYTIYKGSGRSFGDFNLAEALGYAKDSIIKGGGHAGAAGVSVSANKLFNFREQINEYYRSLHLDPLEQENYLRARPDLTLTSLQDLTLDFLDELKKLEPFGPGNPEPVLAIEHPQIIEKRTMGADGQHLRLDIQDQQGNTIKLVAFNAPASWLDGLDPTDPDVQSKTFLITPVENEFNGTRSVEGRLLDILDILDTPQL